MFKATHPANPNLLPKSFQNPHDKPETFNPEPQTLNRACKVGLQLEDHRLACRETPRSRSGSELAWNVVLELSSLLIIKILGYSINQASITRSMRNDISSEILGFHITGV